MPTQSKYAQPKDNSSWFDRLSPRDQSEHWPLKIGPMAHPLIHAGYDQCFDCGKFGHRRDRGAGCTSKVKKAPPFGTWRRVTTGKTYSMNMLEMLPQNLEKAQAEVIAMEEIPEYVATDFDVLTPWVFTEQDMANLEATESFATKNTQSANRSHADQTAGTTLSEPKQSTSKGNPRGEPQRLYATFWIVNMISVEIELQCCKYCEIARSHRKQSKKATAMQCGSSSQTPYRKLLTGTAQEIEPFNRKACSDPPTDNQ
ncbi:uncharacterized protein MELLADRAFT_112134 [Melampsora larici-populina 98AG31]|uniref:Uncharacterized protein n=1 Tax=Melampsora larici-populina (strain 98AG31 / pathotype 3-4-7) TaxID=747676 RepID=F4S5I0_MELLP|nr:uncharacterized protein MELLADRAFT_112134 [Melampsora larici-populina 98AG31]EGG00103.1 hypothetical protein MELLADRAFT_112134 [Melampsora larici-populina 98AG31]